MKKKLISLVSVLVIMLSLCVPAFAAEVPVEPETTAQTEISPRAELTEWIYRIYNGVKQRRLWSRTNGVWLTDWIDLV